MAENLVGIPFDANEITLPDGSFGYDNVLYAQDLAEWFETYFKNGVLVEGQDNTLSTELNVTQTDATHVRVNVGKACVNGRTAFVDTPVVLTINKTVPSMVQWSRVVLELNLDVNINSFRLLVSEGTMGASGAYPPLIRAGGIYQISLASVKAGEQGIAEITDDRPNEALCGISQTLIGLKPPEPIPGDSARNVRYDNTVSGLQGETVQDVIDTVGADLKTAQDGIVALDAKVDKLAPVANPEITVQTASAWTVSSGTYTQSINIPKVTAEITQSVLVDIVASSEYEQTQWAKVWKIETYKGGIKLYATEAIDDVLTLKVKVV